jgi:phenylpropionate dioxygenase-like ring-hydroxylating dioxygenase large terminal subunit
MEDTNFSKEDMQTVQELLRNDTKSVPSVLLEESVADLGTEDIPRDVFFSKEYHELEVEKLWKKVWQWACREEEIPSVGDYEVYDIADLSVIVVRAAPDKIRAFYNSCLHRGAQLNVGGGNEKKISCPFHGWKWNLDGTLAHIPCKWDFDHVEDEAFRLPELRVATWRGFVFINFDPDCESLESYLEIVPEHFKHFTKRDLYIAAHGAQVIPANWKVTLEGFLETYHVFALHPQILPFVGDANAQCDVYGRHNRMIAPIGVQSPHLGSDVDQQILARRMAKMMPGHSRVGQADETLSEGMSARSHFAEIARQQMHKRFGLECSDLSDSEMLDSIRYLIFPNTVVAGDIGVSISSRVRPNGNDPNSSILENLVLLPSPPGESPSPAKTHWLKPDESWTSVPGFPKDTGRVFDQDNLVLSHVQRGLKGGLKPGITLGKHLESRIKHFHHVLDRQLRS